MALRLPRDTTNDQTHAAWIQVIERIKDEQIYQARGHHLFRLIRAVFFHNDQLAAEGGFLFAWIAENYVEAALMLVRRELDLQAGTENLRNLLEDIEAHPDVLTRRRFLEQWQPQSELMRHTANNAFDSYTPIRVPGRPESDHIAPAVVRADLDRAIADADRVRVIAERTRAHRTPRQNFDPSLTFADLHDAIKDLRSVIGRYYTLLTLKTLAQWEPTPQYDRVAPFTKVWVTDPAAVADAADEGVE